MPRQINEEIVDLLLEITNEEQKNDPRRKKLISLLKKLNNLFQKSYEENQYAGYKVYQDFQDLAKFKKFRTKTKLEESMKLALEYETEILDILRGEKIQLVVQRSDITNDGKVTNIRQYIGNEIDFTLGLIKENDVVTGISYLIKETKELVKNSASEKTNQAFLKHYDMYYNKASDLLNHYGKFKDMGINEGNIVEAFYRHLNYIHKTMIIDENQSYNEDIDYPEIAIELYYSVGFDPWWTGGDIGLVQIKANNQQLASLLSIRAVAAKLLNIFTGSTKDITKKEFDKIFNRAQQAEMTGFSKEDAIEKLELLGTLRNIDVNIELLK